MKTKKENDNKDIFIDELFSHMDIANFNPEDFSDRKYNKNNFDIGKKFFKYRYIKKKIKELGPKARIRNTVFIKKSVDNNKLKENTNIRYTYKPNLTEHANMNETIFNDKNDFRNFDSRFLTVVEKSIIHFNFKNYNESYKILFQEKIINSEEEFGEFLLVVNGYDKNVLGSFLSKDKPPNEHKKVINGFMDSIDLKYIYKEKDSNIKDNNNFFLDCFRFLLSRLNLPQDSNLILEIMDTYSIFLFNNNKTNKTFIKQYSSIDAIYLLISTLLALNTMFTRKDIKVMNIITKDQFLEMNKDIDKNEAIGIYEDLEKNPISMSYNYNDILYQKMSILVKENNNNIRSYKKSITQLLENNNPQIKSIENKGITGEDENNNIEENINNNLNIDKEINSQIEDDIKNYNENPNINDLTKDNNNDDNSNSEINTQFLKKYNTTIKFKNRNNRFNIFENDEDNEDLFYLYDDSNENDNLSLTSFSFRENLYTFSDKDKLILTKPTKFIKLINKYSNHYRVFIVDENLEKLIWAKELEIITNTENNTKILKTKGNVHNLLINEIENVHNGNEKSKLISEYIKYFPNEEKEAIHFISIETLNRSYCIKAETKEISLSWYKALKSLVIKNKNENPKSKINKDIISKIKYKAKEIWYTIISPNWNIYGHYLLYKAQNKNDYEKEIIQKDNNFFSNNIFSNNIFTNNIFESISNNIFSNNIYSKNSLLEEKTTFSLDERNRFISEAKLKINSNNYFDYNEFLYLFYFGLPSKMRGNIWSLLIGNPCGINVELYKSYKKLILYINFEHLLNEYDKNKNKEQTISEITNTIINDKYLISQILLNILNFKENFIIKYTVSPYRILSKVYNIARLFFLMRPDIKYNKSLITLAYIFVLVCKDEYKSFCNLYNLICSTYTLQYYLRNEDFIDSRVKFFDELLKKNVPKISLHFKNLDISPELFLVYWFENLFSFTFDYHLFKRIFDLYLLHGECILFQVGLTIIKIQEDELLNFTISDIFKNLKRVPKECKEEYFMEKMYLMNLYSEYQLWKTNIEFEKQKQKLLASSNN